MPLFEYKCNQCGHVFEELVSRSEEKVLPCPQCKAGETEKLMSACATQISAGSAVSACASSGGCSSPQGCPGGGCCPKFN